MARAAIGRRAIEGQLWPAQTPARRVISAGQKWPASNEKA